jgi:hypothetical protein
MTSEKAYAVEARLDNLTSAQTDWANFGSFLNGWGPVTTAHYRLALGGIVHVQMQNLTVGTTANNTTILSSANGLPAGFRPGMVIYKPVRCDVTATQEPSLRIDVDGSMNCFGIGATATRIDVEFSFLAEN